jgi:hypothetical protein
MDSEFLCSKKAIKRDCFALCKEAIHYENDLLPPNDITSIQLLIGINARYFD